MDSGGDSPVQAFYFALLNKRENKLAALLLMGEIDLFWQRIYLSAMQQVSRGEIGENGKNGGNDVKGEQSGVVNDVKNDHNGAVNENTGNCIEQRSIEQSSGQLTEQSSGQSIEHSSEQLSERSTQQFKHQSTQLSTQQFKHQSIEQSTLQSTQQSTEQGTKKRSIPIEQCSAKRAALPSTLFEAQHHECTPNEFTFQQTLEKTILQGISNVFSKHKINQNHLIYDLKCRLSLLQCEFFRLKAERSSSMKEAKAKVRNELAQSNSSNSLPLHPIISHLTVGKATNLLLFDQKIDRIRIQTGHLKDKIESVLRLQRKCIIQKLSASKERLEFKMHAFTQQTNALSSSILSKLSLLSSLMKKPEEKKQVVACFSGFNRDSTPSKEELAAIIVQLGGKCALQGEFHEGITHVISPPSFPKTMRSLGASLLSKWVISVEWLLESAKCGEWIPEEPFAFKTPPNAFQERKIHLTEEFFRENAKYYAKEIFLTFFQRIVKAKLVDLVSEAEIVMTGEQSANGEAFLTWSHFTDRIFPSQ